MATPNVALALSLVHDTSPPRKRRRAASRDSSMTGSTIAGCYGFMPVHDDAWDTAWWHAPPTPLLASTPSQLPLNAMYAELLEHIGNNASAFSPPPPCTPPTPSESSTEALVASVVAEWLQSHEPASPLLQDLFRSKGYQLVPIASPQKSPRQRPPPRRTKPNSMAAWWARFQRITASDVTLTPCQLALVSSPEDILAGFDSLPMPAAHTSDLASRPVDSAFFTNSILFTISLSASSFRMSILSITMRLFFFVASQPSFWAAHAQDGLASFQANSRLERLNDDWYAQLYHALARHLPAAMTADLFRVELDSWRKAGRKYAFLAHHLGLGSLVHLRDYISHAQLWGCTMGGERSCDANDALDFLRHTLAVDRLAETSGSDALMHAMLWALFARFPGFGQRAAVRQPFPGFGMLGEAAVSQPDT